MSQTLRYGLPYILPGQAQKHITHNEAISRLDAIINLGVKMIASAPPASFAEGDAFLISQTPTQDWETHADEIAIFKDSVWQFFTPVLGWMVWVEDIAAIWVFRGQMWESLQELIGNDAVQDSLGINAQADAVNRLSLNSQASLFNHEGSGHRLTINKNSPADTASLVLQTGFSGRAEIGLTGNDDLSLRQSADGTQWADIVTWPAGTGLTRFHGLPFDNLPAAHSALSGSITFIQTGLDIPQFVYCDGAAWRRLNDGTIAAPPASALNPLSAGSHVILSNGNRDMVSSVTGGWTSVRGERGHNTGLFYFEAEIVSAASSTSTLIGLASGDTEASGLNTYTGNFNKSAAIRPDRIFAKGLTITEPSPSYSGQIGDRIMVAADIDTGRVWFGRNGVWLNSASAVPSAADANDGANHNVSLPAGVQFYPSLSSAHTSNTVRLHTGAADVSYTPPEGFSAWGLGT